jgi:hypothetical protein
VFGSCNNRSPDRVFRLALNGSRNFEQLICRDFLAKRMHSYHRVLARGERASLRQNNDVNRLQLRETFAHSLQNRIAITNSQKLCAEWQKHHGNKQKRQNAGWPGPSEK